GSSSRLSWKSSFPAWNPHWPRNWPMRPTRSAPTPMPPAATSMSWSASAMTRSPAAKPLGIARHGARIALGAFLGFAGVSHLTFAREEFRAQVPDFVPLDPDLTVILSGVAEIGLGLSLL